MMGAALELGVRGMVHAEVTRIYRAVDALGNHLVRLAHRMPEALEHDGLGLVRGAIPDGLPAEEQASLAGRIATRALSAASKPHLVVLATTCGEALAGEADRLLPFAEALDVVLRATRTTPSPTAEERIRGARARFALLIDPGAEPIANAARAALLDRLATDVGLPRVLETLRTGAANDVAERLHAALAGTCTPDATRGPLHQRAHLLAAPLVDAFDLHLDGVFAR